MFDPAAYEQSLGDSVEPAELRTAMARAVAHLATSAQYAWAHFERAYRAANGIETLIFTVDVERPQRPAAPIARHERMAAIFRDDLQPVVYALRSGFPTEALHLNLGGEHDPPWLCLDDRSWDEARGRWTAFAFVERIRWWLAATAQGDLHGEAQPAEPVFGSAETLILPPQVLRGGRSTGLSLDVVAVSDTQYQRTYLMRETAQRAGAQGGFVPIFLEALPQRMQRLRSAPRTIKELHDLLADWGLDLVAELRKDLKQLLADQPAQVSAHPLLLLHVPLLRADGSSAGQSDLKAFSVGDSHTFASLGVELGVFHRQGNARPVLNLQPDLARRADDVPVGVVAVEANLNRQTAAAGSGLAADTRAVSLVGGGAIGSHLIAIMRRDGFGQWTVIDHDTLLPHNLQRHVAIEAMVGQPKANITAEFVNLAAGTDETKAIVANVLRESPESEAALAAAALIVDASASIPVSRFLSDHKTATAPRLSVFFNIEGRDVVLIGEDARRELKLADLEAQYYRAVLDTPGLADHIAAAGKGYQYAASCRSVSFQMPEHQVSMLTGAIAGEVRRHLDSDAATIVILSAGEQGLIRSAVPVFPPQHHARGGWEIVIDNGIMQAANALRNAALPNETGGVLLGTIDVSRHQICIVKLVAAPADSFGDRAGFERGTHSLAAIVADANKRTAGQVEYVGEWHSHPRGAAPTASKTDVKQLLWLGQERAVEDLPAIMLIVGDNGGHTISIVFAVK